VSGQSRGLRIANRVRGRSNDLSRERESDIKYGFTAGGWGDEQVNPPSVKEEKKKREMEKVPKGRAAVSGVNSSEASCDPSNPALPGN